MHRNTGEDPTSQLFDDSKDVTSERDLADEREWVMPRTDTVTDGKHVTTRSKRRRDRRDNKDTDDKDMVPEIG